LDGTCSDVSKLEIRNKIANLHVVIVQIDTSVLKRVYDLHKIVLGAPQKS
jgi:hypothetical protein